LIPTNQECFDAVIEEMRKVLKSHNTIKGNAWRLKSERELVDDLMQEFHEFQIKNDPDHELIDIMNCCYLLWAKRRFFKGVGNVR
jgi:hypothetical protein